MGEIGCRLLEKRTSVPEKREAYCDPGERRKTHMWRRKAIAPVFRCSFCGKTKDQVEHLVAGPHRVYMCKSCVECC